MPPLSSPRYCTRLFLILCLASFLAPLVTGKESWAEVRSPNFIVISNSGDKEARRIADQFEQFREVFHNSLPQLRLDLGKPLIIFAVKNEDSLKLLLPGYWEVKGRAHPAGLYVPGEERHFVAVRTNTEAENPYELVYHEYTHAIMNMNFRDLPIWLGEGLAEFYGNSEIRDKDVEIGKIPANHLQALQQNRLIPIDTLLMADAKSPYYNEANRVSVFYAESWAIVHYLMMDPEARKRQLLANFLNAWNTSGNQVEAAQQTFGDLKKFSQAMEAYSRQPTFYVGRVHTSVRGDPKSYESRELPPAELAANRALFYIHTQRPKEAIASIDESIQINPNLPLAYEARGLRAYSQGEFSVAETDFSRSIDLHSSSYCAYYFAAETRLRRGIPSQEEFAEVTAWLEKAVTMNPQFAPAYAALASAFSTRPETYQKAFEAAKKSVQLEPGNLAYAINYGYVLLNAGKTADARVLTGRIKSAARTPAEQAAADSLAAAMESRASYDKQVAESAERAKHAMEETAAQPIQTSTTRGEPRQSDSAVDKANSGVDIKSAATSKHAGETEYAVEGIIGAADCNDDTAGKLTLLVNKVPMKFFYSSLKALQVVMSAKGEGPACSDWKGKKARLYFYGTRTKGFQGEIDTIQFF